MDISKLKIGTKVAIKATLERQYSNGAVTYQAIPCDKEGYYIGYRVVNNGLFVDVDEGTYCDSHYKPIEHYKVALIVFNERQNPVKVLPKHIKLMYQEE